MRLDKLLSHMGYGTRKEIKKLMKQGVVLVDGQVIKDSSVHVHPEKQRIEIYGESVQYREFVYLMMNKPKGVISATEDLVERTVIDLLPEEYLPFQVFPVGRLDKDTEGLLLITNDGKLTHELLSPKKHVPKTYIADVSGVVTQNDIHIFRRGVTLDDGYETLPSELRILEVDELTRRSRIELTIYEGKFHQVKRMFEAVHKKVVHLKRISMGPLTLDPELYPGDFRELTENELEMLKGRST
ncbi:rRNA pseudouridine synthase [Microaerobacter geothermalis]|uniref:pseudouridine synthase n=1 Tax=Microaerobacter geothermalis TaxID=674972 RepID=UPI001F23AFB9|nr:pseudouridine synthase [Microaerobacter geothermalis]MCF6093930.1 rRNA pseudouridine synthase [Microaerobacter geothermalis]